MVPGFFVGQFSPMEPVPIPSLYIITDVMPDAPGRLRHMDDVFMITAMPEFAKTFVVDIGKGHAVAVGQRFVGTDDFG